MNGYRAAILYGARTVALATILGGTSFAASAQAAVSVRIAQQDMGDALLSFSRQSGRQILFSPELVRGKKARSVHARMDVDTALATLLKGSGLTHRVTDGGAYLIVAARAEAPGKPGAAPAAPARQTPVAAAPVQADEPEQEIVVIGTAGAGTRRQDAAYAVTTIDGALAQRLGTASTAEVLRAVPGVSTESSGGKTGANIFVRGYPSGGDAEYVTFQSQGVPFFPPPTLSFLENTQLIRIDETVQRVEAVRGGTSALFSNGQPGLTINLVQRTGKQTPEGLVKLSATDFGELRADGYVSGPIDADTTYMIGGYYSVSRGIRDPQFEAERGGQITANIRRDLGGRGTLLLFGRYLDDRGQWLLPIPVVQNGDKISAYPGFPAGSGTLAGNDNRFGIRNDGSRVDLADGRGARIGNIGGNFDYELADGLTFRDRASWLHGDANTTGLVPVGAPVTAAAYAASKGGTIATLRATNGSGALSAATPLLEAGMWTVEKRLNAFVNDAALEWKTDRNTLTGGVYYSRYTSRDRWNLGNSLLLVAVPFARGVDLSLSNGAVVTLNGFGGGSFF